MPQIEQIAATWASQFFWLAVAFGLVFFVIGLGMLPKVQSTVDQRDKTVADDLAAAESARKAADETEARWRAEENAARAAAQQKLAETRELANASTAKVLAAAAASVDEKLATAEAQIAASTAAAMREIEGVAADAARDIVLRIAGTQVSEVDAQQAVKAVLHG